MKTIDYVTAADPFHDRKAWSGTIYKVREAIENAGFNVFWIPVRLSFLHNLYVKISAFRYGRLVSRNMDNVAVRLRAEGIKFPDETIIDYYFFLGDAQLTKHLNLSKPVIYYADATFDLMCDYYFDMPSKSLRRQADANEKIGLNNSSIVIASSQWAVDSATSHYNQSSAKCKVLEFGANLDDEDIVKSDKYEKGDVLNVLFSGVNWERKGAAIAIDTVKKLINTGINAKLLLVGIKLDDIPANYRNLPWVEYFGFMNKNMPEQYQRYVDAIKRSHLLLLPTSAECSAIVFSEAAAYGLPVFTYDTGGIGNYVIDGYNGYRLRLGASANDFSVKIKETLFDGKLTKLSGNALQLYADNLSWSAWSRRFRGIIEEYENNK